MNNYILYIYFYAHDLENKTVKFYTDIRLKKKTLNLVDNEY